MRDRLVAAAVHLLFSALIVGSLVAMVMWVWFPGPLSRLEGVSVALKVLVLVDVVLGPALTLIVFNRAKPSLRKDLATIVAVQLAAFFYGAWVLFDARPAVLAWDTGNVYVVRTGALEGDPMPEWVTPVYGWHGPGWIYAEAIHDPDFIAAVLQGEQADVSALPAQYRPVADNMAHIRRAAPSVEQLLAVPVVAEAWDAFKETHDVSAGEVFIFPLLGAHSDGGVVMSRKTGDFIGMLDVDIRKTMMIPQNNIDVPDARPAPPEKAPEMEPEPDAGPEDGDPQAPAGNTV